MDLNHSFYILSSELYIFRDSGGKTISKKSRYKEGLKLKLRVYHIIPYQITYFILNIIPKSNGHVVSFMLRFGRNEQKVIHAANWMHVTSVIIITSITKTAYPDSRHSE